MEWKYDTLAGSNGIYAESSQLEGLIGGDVFSLKPSLEHSLKLADQC